MYTIKNKYRLNGFYESRFEFINDIVTYETYFWIGDVKKFVYTLIYYILIMYYNIKVGTNK